MSASHARPAPATGSGGRPAVTRGARAPGTPWRVTITAGAGAVCQFENRFIPAGSIAILKTTRGAGATTGFVVSPLRDPELQYLKSARTQGDGDTAIARGDRTRRLRLGRYVIQETEPVTAEAGRWTLVAVTCGGRLRAFEQGRLTVTLTRERPHAVCHFINGFTPDAPPVPGPLPPPPPPPTVLPDLVVTKRALQRSVLFGSIAAYEITVRNDGQGDRRAGRSRRRPRGERAARVGATEPGGPAASASR